MNVINPKSLSNSYFSRKRVCYGSQHRKNDAQITFLRQIFDKMKINQDKDYQGGKVKDFTLTSKARKLGLVLV